MINFYLKFKFNKHIRCSNYLFAVLLILTKSDIDFLSNFKYINDIKNNFSKIRKYNIEGLDVFTTIFNNYSRKPFNLCISINNNIWTNAILKSNYIKKIIFLYFFNTFLYKNVNYIKPKNINVINFENDELIKFKTRRSSIFMLNYKFIDHRRYFNIIFKDLTYTILDTLSMKTLLKQRYGIGSTISNLACKHLGISEHFKTSNLPVSPYYNKLSIFFSNNIDNLDYNLMNYNLKGHNQSIQSRTYKGFRLLKGYPINGQRTRSNHKTAQRKPYKFSFYYI